MGAFYNSTRTAAVKASAESDVEANARVAGKQMDDAVKAAITKFAKAGAFECFAISSIDLDATPNVRVSEQSFTGSSGTERIDTIEVGSDVFDILIKRLRGADFDVSPYSSGINRVSWRTDKSGLPPLPGG